MEQTEIIHQTVDEIIALYEMYGNEDYVGEPVSQIEHMCQCALLAKEAGANDDTILAAFLHDIGHLYAFAFPEKELQHMDNFGIVDHEKLGGEYLLRKGFSKTIAKMVASHVKAKRYLTYKYADYYNLLSDASKKTLEFQGGIMTEQEALLFESDVLYPKYLTLRRWDEKAKEEHHPLPPLNYFRQLMTTHLTREKATL